MNECGSRNQDESTVNKSGGKMMLTTTTAFCSFDSNVKVRMKREEAGNDGGCRTAFTAAFSL
jgi:hypothetical protein